MFIKHLQSDVSSIVEDSTVTKKQCLCSDDFENIRGGITNNLESTGRVDSDDEAEVDKGTKKSPKIPTCYEPWSQFMEYNGDSTPVS